jgi:predicted metal-dependent peptidase
MMMSDTGEILTAEDKVVKAKIQLLNEKPFFGYLVSYLQIKETKDLETAGVDAKGHMYYNPDWISKLSGKDIKFVLAHEVMHLCLEHLSRGNKYDKGIFNIAADVKVNDILIKNNMSPPKNCICPRNNEYEIGDCKILDIENKCSEDIYFELLKKAKKVKVTYVMFDKHFFSDDKNEKGDGSGDKEEKGKQKGMPGGNIDWKDQMAKAFAMSKMKGNEPLGIERSIDDLLNPKNGWKEILKKYVVNLLPSDYTWERPSKRSISYGFYMPATKRETVELCVAIDTSGSIDNELLKEFLSEIVGMSKEFEQIKVRILTCDTQIHDDYELTNGEVERLSKMAIHGGGGTDFKPVFERLKNDDVKALIYFTDGYGDFPNSKPKFMTIWAMPDKGVAIPFGELITLR